MTGCVGVQLGGISVHPPRAAVHGGNRAASATCSCRSRWNCSPHVCSHLAMRGTPVPAIQELAEHADLDGSRWREVAGRARA